MKVLRCVSMVGTMILAKGISRGGRQDALSFSDQSLNSRLGASTK